MTVPDKIKIAFKLFLHFRVHTDTLDAEFSLYTGVQRGFRL